MRLSPRDRKAEAWDSVEKDIPAFRTAIEAEFRELLGASRTTRTQKKPVAHRSATPATVGVERRRGTTMRQLVITCAVTAFLAWIPTRAGAPNPDNS
jgi:hypothetical protein